MGVLNLCLCQAGGCKEEFRVNNLENGKHFEVVFDSCFQIDVN